MDLCAELRDLDRRIAAFDDEFALLARTDESARRLTTIPGIGVSAWLGLVPRQMTTGGKPRLAGISKRGNKYLRKLLIHGARAALPSLAKSDTALGVWLRGLLVRTHVNTVVVALAAKLARIVWAVLRHGGRFDLKPMPAS